MIAQKHTPGPWEAVLGGVVRDDDGMRVADVDGIDIAEMEANAHLIAAAPEMLEALKDANEWFMAGDDVHPNSVVGKIRAAVAKATGQ